MGGLDWSDISMRWTSCMSREIILVGCSCLDIIDGMEWFHPIPFYSILSILYAVFG
jgi:hypothetical protein